MINFAVVFLHLPLRANWQSKRSADVTGARVNTKGQAGPRGVSTKPEIAIDAAAAADIGIIE